MKGCERYFSGVKRDFGCGTVKNGDKNNKSNKRKYDKGK